MATVGGRLPAELVDELLQLALGRVVRERHVELVPLHRRLGVAGVDGGGAEPAVGVAHVLLARPEIDRGLVLRGGAAEVLRAYPGVAFLDQLVRLLVAPRLRSAAALVPRRRRLVRLRL